MSKNFKYYFSFKNGDGNRFLPYSKKELESSSCKTKTKFIIQYEGNPEPIILSKNKVQKDYTLEVKGKETNVRVANDFLLLKRFMQEDLKKITRFFYIQ